MSTMCMQIGRQLFEMFGNVKFYFSENFHMWDFEMLVVFKGNETSCQL